MDGEVFGTDSRRPAVRKWKSWGMMAGEKRGRETIGCGDSERERGRVGSKSSSLSVFTACVLYPPPHRRRDGKMKRERSSKQLTSLHR